jgi:hypothetical protein
MTTPTAYQWMEKDEREFESRSDYLEEAPMEKRRAYLLQAPTKRHWLENAIWAVICLATVLGLATAIFTAYSE